MDFKQNNQAVKQRSPQEAVLHPLKSISIPELSRHYYKRIVFILIILQTLNYNLKKINNFGCSELIAPRFQDIDYLKIQFNQSTTPSYQNMHILIIPYDLAVFRKQTEKKRRPPETPEHQPGSIQPKYMNFLQTIKYGGRVLSHYQWMPF